MTEFRYVLTSAMVRKDYFDSMLGKQFNDLLVECFAGYSVDINSGKRNTLIQCLCKCGNIKVLKATLVKNGTLSSCGCTWHKSRLTDTERLERKQQIVNYQKEYRRKNKTKLTAGKRNAARSAREEGIKHYGGKCVCCGEANEAFLTMEHINGRDKTKRRITGQKAWLDAKWNNWPTDITLLCYNCNCAKGVFGECPHKKQS